jgi:hypothetical protein
MGGTDKLWLVSEHMITKDMDKRVCPCHPTFMFSIQQGAVTRVSPYDTNFHTTSIKIVGANPRVCPKYLLLLWVALTSSGLSVNV